MPMSALPFYGAIHIDPPLSEAQRDYINGLYFPWKISEDGGNIIPHEQLEKTNSPSLLMARLIDTFLRLNPTTMRKQAEHRHDAPSFFGHVCNGSINCRAHRNIVVENNRVGQRRLYPEYDVEWLNKPEDDETLSRRKTALASRRVAALDPVCWARDHRTYREIFSGSHGPLGERRRHFDPVELFSFGLPLRGHRAGKVDPAMADIWDKANAIDEWPAGDGVTDDTAKIQTQQGGSMTRDPKTVVTDRQLMVLRDHTLDIAMKLTAVDDIRYPGDPVAILCGEAADEIERLRGLLAEGLDHQSPDFDETHPQWADRVKEAIAPGDNWWDELG